MGPEIFSTIAGPGRPALSRCAITVHRDPTWVCEYDVEQFIPALVRGSTFYLGGFH